MTLFRQIALVFTVFFLTMLAIVLAISFEDSRSYIENELFVKAQNTASTLGVTMSQTEGDVGKMSVMAQALFDTGYFRRIALEDINGSTVFEMKRESAAKVPAWFLSVAHLAPQSAAAQVSSGWTPVGMVRVVADNAESLEYLYGLFKKIVAVFVLAAVLGLGMVAAMLGRILKPVRTMRDQAEGVLQNRFIINRDVPKTPELRRTTEAINALVERMKQMHEKLIDLTNRNRDLEYGDAVTGLYNRRYFLVRYGEYARSEDFRAAGCVVALHLSDTAKANSLVGYDRVNTLFAQIAKEAGEIAARFEESVACRVSGVEFALLLPAAESDEAKEAAEELVARARKRVDALNDLSGVICLAAAVVPYEKGMSAEKLFASIDLTLNDALALNCDAVRSGEVKGSLPTRKSEWRELIRRAMEEGTLRPSLSQIYSEDGRHMAADLLFDLPSGAEKIPYRVFAPMMMQLGLFPAYVRYAFDYLLASDMDGYTRIAMEFPVAYLDTVHEMEWLVERCAELKNKGVEFVVEMGQNDLLRKDPESVEVIAETLDQHGVRTAIVRFDANPKVLELLRRIRPLYVKMHCGQFADMGETLRDSLTLLLKSVGTKLFVTGVESREILEELEGAGIDFFVV